MPSSLAYARNQTTFRPICRGDVCESSPQGSLPMMSCPGPPASCPVSNVFSHPKQEILSQGHCQCPTERRHGGLPTVVRSTVAAAPRAHPATTKPYHSYKIRPTHDTESTTGIWVSHVNNLDSFRARAQDKRKESKSLGFCCYIPLYILIANAVTYRLCLRSIISRIPCYWPRALQMGLHISQKRWPGFAAL